MPWLIREAIGQDPNEALLFIHIPRCGGTSLNKQYCVLLNSMNTVSIFRKLTISYFGYRYRTLEASNFPIYTYEHCIVLLMLGCFVIVGLSVQFWSYWLLTSAIFLSFTSTILFTAPMLRYHAVRRLFISIGSLIGSYSDAFIYGAQLRGFYMHLTAQRLVETGICDAETMNRVTSFAIVRNPYSRMVSVYKYNKLGRFESFKIFVRRWKRMHDELQAFRLRTEDQDTPKAISEWDAYCHLLPQCAYTHDANGEQLVRFVVKMEDFKCENPEPSDALLPEVLKKVWMHLHKLRHPPLLV